MERFLFFRWNIVVAFYAHYACMNERVVAMLLGDRLSVRIIISCGKTAQSYTNCTIQALHVGVIVFIIVVSETIATEPNNIIE